MFKTDRKTALLPVGTCFFNKRNLNLKEIQEVWAGCTVQLVTNEDGRLRYVVGSGTDRGEHYKKELFVKHDQTGANLGRMVEVGRAIITKDEIRIISGAAAFPKNGAPVLVYK